MAKKTAGLIEHIKIIGPTGKEVACDAILDTGATRTSIDLEIRDAVKEFIPNLNITDVNIKSVLRGCF